MTRRYLDNLPIPLHLRARLRELSTQLSLEMALGGQPSLKSGHEALTLITAILAYEETI